MTDADSSYSSSMNNDINITLDMLIDMSYNQTTISKNFVWSCVGEYIVNNMLIKNNNTIKIPILDENGDIKFNGETFKEIVVEIKEENK